MRCTRGRTDTGTGHTFRHTNAHTPFIGHQAPKHTQAHDHTAGRGGAPRTHLHAHTHVRTRAPGWPGGRTKLQSRRRQRPQGPRRPQRLWRATMGTLSRGLQPGLAGAPTPQPRPQPGAPHCPPHPGAPRPWRRLGSAASQRRLELAKQQTARNVGVGGYSRVSPPSFPRQPQGRPSLRGMPPRQLVPARCATHTRALSHTHQAAPHKYARARSRYRTPLAPPAVPRRAQQTQDLLRQGRAYALTATGASPQTRSLNPATPRYSNTPPAHAQYSPLPLTSPNPLLTSSQIPCFLYIQ